MMKLDFSVVNDTFTMSVSDNGPGVSVDKQKCCSYVLNRFIMHRRNWCRITFDRGIG